MIMIAQALPSILSDIFQEVAADTAMAITFAKGHYVEVTNYIDVIMQDVDQSNAMAFPLAWLVMDFKEVINPRLGVYADASVKLILAKDTDPNWTFDERMNNNFIPVLYKIYESLCERIKKSIYFFNSNDTLLKHTKIDRPYWGKDKQANFFNHAVDAIELDFLLSLKKKQFC